MQVVVSIPAAHTPRVPTSKLCTASNSTRLTFGHLTLQLASSAKVPTCRMQNGIERKAEHRQVARRAMLSSEDDLGASSTGRPEPSKALKVLNELTKWAVSGVALFVLLTRRDAPVMWAVIGSIANVTICKVLKKVINEKRPNSAWKADPGMPSSHAQSLGFLSWYVAISMLAGWGLHKPQTQLAAGGVLAAGLFMTWLRVVSGYHTTPQVTVGYALGAVTALGWRHWGVSQVLPLAAQNPQLVMWLQATCVLAVLAFAMKTLKGLVQDARRFQKLATD